MMWLRIACLFWIAIVSIDGNGIPDGTKCYDCNYDPSLVPTETGDDFDWAAKPDRGYPRCSLHPTVDVALVADTLCQGTCFIRKDSNGLVYRGCADPWNLPYHVDTTVNCTRKDDGSIWWFCTGTHCNHGTFGDEGICPGDYDSYQNDVPSTEYTKEGVAGTGEIQKQNYMSNAEVAYSNQLPESVRNNLDPYVIMESGWQAYQNELEPKSGDPDDASYVEPPATVATGVGHQYGVPRIYTYKPPLPVNVYRLPALKNPTFAEQYRSLVPSPGRRVTNAFGPPENIRSSGQNTKQTPPKGKSHKSWQGDKYSVSYGKQAAGGGAAEHVKSAYSSPEHTKSWYDQQPAKSYQNIKSTSSKATPSHVKSTDNRLYVLAYAPKKSRSGSGASGQTGHVKSISSVHPKSGYAGKSHSQVLLPQYRKSPASFYKSGPLLQPNKQYQPKPMSYGQKSYERMVKSQQSESKSDESHTKSSQLTATNWLGSQQLFRNWLDSQQQSQESNANWQSAKVSSRQYDLTGEKSFETSEKSSASNTKTQNSQLEAYQSSANWYDSPQQPSLPAATAYRSSANAYGANVPVQILKPIPMQSPKLNAISSKQAPDYKSTNFGDFWYDNYYRGEKPDRTGYNDPPVTGINPCNEDCSGNPSGLYPHPTNSDWFIQCGSGVAESGYYCSCCRPNYLRCPDGTLFDVNTRVCSTIQESEYSYKPVF